MKNTRRHTLQNGRVSWSQSTVHAGLKPQRQVQKDKDFYLVVGGVSPATGEVLLVSNEEEQNAAAHLWKFLVCLNQGLKALSDARRSHHDGTIVAGLQGFLVFLCPDETQHGFVQELVLLLENDNKTVTTRLPALGLLHLKREPLIEKNRPPCGTSIWRTKSLTMSLKTPGLMRFVSLATWKTLSEPSASSWWVRDNKAQKVPAVAPPTLLGKQT